MGLNYATCQLCKCSIDLLNDYGFESVNLNRRGEGLAYLCHTCKSVQYGYNHENTERNGARKKNGFTFGQEFETMGSSLKARIELVANKYHPTSDCTVDCEYKSPIFEGLNSFSKVAKTIGNLIESGDIAINPQDCGTHTHLGHVDYINRESIRLIAKNYYNIFGALSDYMKANEADVIKVFGQPFKYYAAAIGRNTDPFAHENFVNLQHSYSLEFRICYYKNYAQYMHAVKLCRAITEVIINNYLKNYFNDNYDKSRYSDIVEYRKHKAKICSNKIVALFEKYADSAPEE